MEIKKARRMQSALQIPGFIVAALLGVVFLVLTILSDTQKIPETFEPVEAVIARIDCVSTISDDHEEYETVIRYSFGDYQSGEVIYPKYDSTMKVGDILPIFVDPANPSDFRIEANPTVVPYVLCGAFILIGVGGIIYYVKKWNKNKGGNEA